MEPHEVIHFARQTKERFHYELGKDTTPCLLVETLDDRVLFVVAPDYSVEALSDFAAALCGFMAKQAWFLAEAFFRPEESEGQPRPRNDPAAKEAVGVMRLTVTGESWSTLLPFHLDDHGQLVWEDDVPLNGEGTAPWKALMNGFDKLVENIGAWERPHREHVTIGYLTSRGHMVGMAGEQEESP